MGEQGKDSPPASSVPEVGAYLRVREHPNQERPRAISLPINQGLPLPVSTMLQVLREDLHEPDLSLDHLRVYDRTIPGYRKMALEERLDVSLMENRCYDILWESAIEQRKSKLTTNTISPANHSLNTSDLHSTNSLKSRVDVLEKSLVQSNMLMQAVLSALPSDTLSSKEFRSALDAVSFQMDENPSTLTLNLARSLQSVIHPHYLQHKSSICTESPDSRGDILLNATVSKRTNVGEKPMLHFAILYSNPLVHVIQGRGKDKVAYLLNDPVNFSGECNNIKQSLAKHCKAINIDIECANREQFTRTMQSKPLILHIVCHGSLDADTKEFFLEFEMENAELLKLTPTKLREFLDGDDMSATKIVFINACHSEGVGTVFFEYGVTCVVVVNSEHKIKDDFATKFSNCFYSELLEGRTIKAAFNKARSQMKRNDPTHCETCCCGHKHKPWCKWYNEALKNEMEFAHALHEVVCDCPEAYARIHYESCYWYESFEMKYIENPADSVKFISDKEVQVCCCSPELSHDETLKMKLLFKDDDEKYGEEVLFDNLVAGELKLRNANFCGNPTYNQVVLIGQNKLIYNMIKYFFEGNTTKRLIYLVGEQGMGKSTVCKFFFNYMRERHKFDNMVPIFDMIKITTITGLDAKVTGMRNISDMESKWREQSTLIILDNMDAMLEHQWEKYNQRMNEYIEQTKIRFIVTITNRELIESKMLHKDSVIVSIPNLNAQMAAKLLKLRAEDYLPMNDKNIYTLQTKDLFSKMRHTPVSIISIAHNLKLGKDFNRILFAMQDKGANASKPTPDIEDPLNGSMDEDAKLMKLLEGIQNTNTDMFNILCYVACFPNGMFLNDFIDAIEMRHLPNMPSDWLSPLMYLSSVSLDKQIDPEEFEKLDQEISDFANKGIDRFDIVSHFLRYSNQSRRDSIINIKYEVIGNTEEILILSKPNLHRVIYQLENGDGPLIIFDNMLNAIRFHQLFLSSIIVTHKELFKLQEELIEHSAISYSVIWNFLDPSEGCLIRYFAEKNLTEPQLKDIVRHHESNYRALITQKDCLSIDQGIEFAMELTTTQRDSFIETIEDFLIKILTVNKIYEDISTCSEFASCIQSLLKTDSRKILKRLNFKVEMYQANLLFNQMKKQSQNITPENKQLMHQRISTLEEMQSELDNNQDLPVLEGEYLTLKLFFLKFKLLGLVGSDNIEVKRLIEMTKINLYRIGQDIKNLAEDVDGIDFRHDWAKIYLVLIQESFEMDKNENLVEILIEINAIFKESNSCKLQMLTLLLICKFLDKSIEEERIDPTCCLEYAKEGAILCQEIKLTNYERDFNTLITKLEQKIKYRHENKFIFLQSCPLGGMEPEGILCFKRSLRDRLYDTLNNLDKDLTVSYKNMSEQNFKALFSQDDGWKLMVVDMWQQNEKALVLENDKLDPYYISIEEIARLNILASGIKADVLIILNDKPEQVVKFFKKTGVKTIVYFDFSLVKSQPCSIDLFTPFWKEEFKHIFLKKFIEEFAKGEQVPNCVDQAKIETVERISYWMSTECKLYKTVVSSYNSKSTLETLKPEDLNISQIDVVCISNTEAEISCSLQFGKLQELPGASSWSKPFSDEALIPRNKEIYTLAKLLREHTHVNLTGAQGVGKSFLAQQLAWELNIRELYPDGVFYFPLSECKSAEISVRQFMAEKLGNEFFRDTPEFFHNKKCLIILDSYEKILNKKLMPPTYLLDALRQSHVHTLFVTTEIESATPAVVQGTVEFKLQPLLPLQSLAFSLSQNIPNRVFFNFDDVTKDKLLKSDTLTDEKGVFSNIFRRLKRFYDRELNFNYDSSICRKPLVHSTSLFNHSNTYSHAGSGDILDSSRLLEGDVSDQFSRFDINLHTYNSSQTPINFPDIPNIANSPSKSSQSKSKGDSKKESKHSKYNKSKKKNKKTNS